MTEFSGIWAYSPFPDPAQALWIRKGSTRPWTGIGERELDFGTTKPKLITYYSAKGLTFDTVLMPMLVSDAAWKRMQARSVKLLFVGITRATRWVYLSSSDGEQLPALRRLLPLAESGDLTVRRDNIGSQDTPMNGSTGPPTCGPDLGFL